MPFQSSTTDMSAFTIEALTDALASPWALPGTLAVGGVCYLVFRRGGLPLPPGPTISWFGLGGKDAVNMPQAYAWLVFADWQKKFGQCFVFIWKVCGPQSQVSVQGT